MPCICPAFFYFSRINAEYLRSVPEAHLDTAEKLVFLNNLDLQSVSAFFGGEGTYFQIPPHVLNVF
jgi:hypothetical protein